MILSFPCRSEVINDLVVGTTVMTPTYIVFQLPFPGFNSFSRPESGLLMPPILALPRLSSADEPSNLTRSGEQICFVVVLFSSDNSFPSSNVHRPSHLLHQQSIITQACSSATCSSTILPESNSSAAKPQSSKPAWWHQLSVLFSFISLFRIPFNQIMVRFQGQRYSN